jgi:hypothetical protein
MSAVPDIALGPGDTGPLEEIVLLDAPVAPSIVGLPMNLQNADLTFKTVVVEYQNRVTTDPKVTRGVVIRQTSPTVKRGTIWIDWLSTGGPVVPPGSNHDLRFVITDNAGHQQTVPPAGQGYWLAVSPAFRS